MVIRPLDDPTYLLNLWSPIYDPSVWGTWDGDWNELIRQLAHGFLLASHWHVRHISPFFELLTGPKSISARPSDLNTMTNTALEAIASSNGNKWCPSKCRQAVRNFYSTFMHHIGLACLVPFSHSTKDNRIQETVQYMWLNQQHSRREKHKIVENGTKMRWTIFPAAPIGRLRIVMRLKVIPIEIQPLASHYFSTAIFVSLKHF